MATRSELVAVVRAQIRRAYLPRKPAMYFVSGTISADLSACATSFRDRSTSILRGQSPALLLLVGCKGRARQGWRKFGDSFRDNSQIVVGEAFGHRVHGSDNTLLLAEEVELDQQDFGAMAGEADRTACPAVYAQENPAKGATPGRSRGSACYLA